MIVVGGVYAEHCANPLRRSVLGSGMRAAGAVAGVVTRVQLHCAIDSETRESAHVVAAGLGVSLAAVERTEPVAFSYYTPLSSPSIDGREASMRQPIDVSARAALVFGMIEGTPRVRARRLVVDPQQPRDMLDLNLEGIEARRLAVCANARETELIGRKKTLEGSARAVLRKTGADFVATKCGACGVLLTTQSSQQYVAAQPTDSVMPLGTGDVFAAALTYAWAQLKRTPLVAAQIASASAARWAMSEVLPLPIRSIVRSGLPGRKRKKPAVRVYIAGPYFTLGERWLVDLVRDSLSGLGAQTFSPFHDIGHGGEEVAEEDLKGLRKCDAVIALLDGEDGGTLFEAGWATKSRIPIVCFSASRAAEWRKMLLGTGAEVHSDLSTAVYRAVWRGLARR